MRIAVSYENGEIFQHFGRTETFKIYDVEDGKTVRSEVIGTDGMGHGALAGFLAGHGVDTVICGGIGPGAQSLLSEIGMRLYAGITGGADEAVRKLLEGKLVSAGVTCHHSEEGHGCGGHCHGD